uniref:Reverse transcriptase domain-containing protein n=1 Tax=Anolis carolinensis TaxID=28377 RepID=A0A803TZ01_ANOCA
MEFIQFFSEVTIKPREDSDHQPLAVVIYSHSDIRPTNPLDVKFIHSMSTLQCKRLKWQSVNLTAIEEYLCNPQVVACGEVIKASSSNSIQVLQTFSVLCSNLKSLLTYTPHNTRKDYIDRTNPWFGQDCKILRQSLRKSMRKAIRYPNQDLHNNMLSLRRSYKKLISQKKSLYNIKIWSELDSALHLKNSVVFWQLVSSKLRQVRFSIDSPIPASQWETFYSDLFNKVGNSNNSSNVKHVTTYYNPDTLPAWPQVEPHDVIDINNTLQNNKAPGEDFLPAELFKNNRDWWAQLLAGLFSHINNSCSIPRGWQMSIIVPIHKNGEKTNPKNYRPISLIDITAKIYSKYLLIKIEEWSNANNILCEEQSGFRQGRSTIDNCFVLQHIIQKYNSRGMSLYTAFIDLSSAFDTICRNTLWEKFAATNIDRRLLILIISLYSDTVLKVRLGPSGALSNEIKTSTGVRQGCILALFLFNFYINDIMKTLSSDNLHGPKVLTRTINILLYADDMVIMAMSPVGLRRSLAKFNLYCELNSLILNKDKSKIMVIGKNRKWYTWTLNGVHLEQTNSYKYLGITFSSSGAWSNHITHSIQRATKAAGSIYKLYHHRYPGTIRPALEVFKKKIMPTLIFGAEIWGHTNLAKIEAFQVKQLRTLLGLSRTTLMAAVRAELGMLPVKAQILMRQFNYWSKVNQMNSSRLPHLCLEDQDQRAHKSSWVVALNNEMAKTGIPLQFLNDLGSRAKQVLMQRTHDIYAQLDLASIGRSSATKFLASHKMNTHLEHYLTIPVPLPLRRIYTRARFEQIGIMMQTGRYCNIPRNERFCVWGDQKVEDIEHFLIDCPAYAELRHRYLHPLLSNFRSPNRNDLLTVLLQGQERSTIIRVSLFTLKAIKKRAHFLKEEESGK